MLRRGEVRAGEKEEVERKDEEVEDRLEGWREGQAAEFKIGGQGWGISVEV